jgi:hypothetical protein
MIQIVINPEYNGPTILDWGTSSRNVEDEFVEVKWENTRQEINQLESLSDCNFRLFVPDTDAQERAAISLEEDLDLSITLMASAKLALNARKAYDWRNFTDDKPLPLTRNILARMTADTLRKGKEPVLAQFAGDFASENGINPIDADVLLRLQVLKG